MPILEQDLRLSIDPLTDLRHIQQGRAVVIHRTPEVLRILKWGALVDPHTQQQTEPGLMVVEFQRAKLMFDDDIVTRDRCRYSQVTNVRVRQFYPDGGIHLLAHDIMDAHRRFKRVPRNRDQPKVRQLIRNRIRRYLR